MWVLVLGRELGRKLVQMWVQRLARLWGLELDLKWGLMWGRK